jgi:hypothetical protein
MAAQRMSAEPIFRDSSTTSKHHPRQSVPMAKTASSSDRLIQELRLHGTMFEQLLLNPDGWSNSEWLARSPELNRYAQDVRSAFSVEGWRPPKQSIRRLLLARYRRRR